MATFEVVNTYLQQLNQLVEQVNQDNNYEECTRPLMLKAMHLSLPLNRGHLINYINLISDAANCIYSASNDAEIQLGFCCFNISVQILREYLAKHWWQYGGAASCCFKSYIII